MKNKFIIILFLSFFSCYNAGERRIEYYENGQIKSEHDFKDGKLNGVSVKYYPNGNIESRTDYINDVMHGKSYKFYTNGEIAGVLQYFNGRIIGSNKYYDKKGKLREICEYDSSSHLVDRIVYTGSGEIDFQKMTPIAYTNKDTFKTGEEIVFFSKLANADPDLYKEGTLIIHSGVNENGYSIDTVFDLTSNNFLGFYYTFLAKDTGKHQISGSLVFPIITDSARIEAIYNFNYEYFVEN
jgi:hypothetical protein